MGVYTQTREERDTSNQPRHRHTQTKSTGTLPHTYLAREAEDGLLGNEALGEVHVVVHAGKLLDIDAHLVAKSHETWDR